MKTTASKWFPAAAKGTGPDHCECCEREDLKKTVPITNGTSTIWVGTGCAARLCGSTITEFRRASKRAYDAAEAERAEAEFARNKAIAAWLGRPLYEAARELAGVPVGPAFKAAFGLLIASFDATH
jgi:hypothetical protein